MYNSLINLLQNEYSRSKIPNVNKGKPFSSHFSLHRRQPFVLPFSVSILMRRNLKSLIISPIKSPKKSPIILMNEMNNIYFEENLVHLHD